MEKAAAAYIEHILDLFTEILHEAVMIKPLREEGTDITPSLVQGLQFVFQHGDCSVRDMAQGLSMTLSAASQLTERLVRKELVTRNENKRDRRLSEIRLTDEGRTLVEHIRARRVAEMSKILSKMDPECYRMLIESLENFITSAIEGEQSALETCSHCGDDHLAECIINKVYHAATGMPIRQV